MGARLLSPVFATVSNAIYRIPAAGGTPILVYDRKGACEPHWSPDGQRLVYETETQICTIQPDGKKNRVITFFGGVQRYGRFSPDGKWIVFCQGTSERGPWQLYKIPADGGTPIPITEAPPTCILIGDEMVEAAGSRVIGGDYSTFLQVMSPKVTSSFIEVALSESIFIRPLSSGTHWCQHRTTAWISLRVLGERARVRGIELPRTLT